MAKPWSEAVRKSKQLSYHCQNSISGLWAGALSEALRHFDHQASNFVKLVKADDSKSANIEIQAGGGKIDYTYLGNPFQTFINGSGYIGRNQLLSIDGIVEKSMIILPNMPNVNAPRINGPSRVRPAGKNILIFIALHELIHACGLEDKDHTSLCVFDGHPSPNGSADGPDKDVMETRTQKKRVNMPPFTISKTTLSKIASNWN
jgi:hypothetical protein